MHTQTPWRVEETQATLWIGTPKGESKLDDIVCGMDIIGLKPEFAARVRANGAFIVQAVNSHADLLAALEAALNAVSFTVRQTLPGFPESQMSITQGMTVEQGRAIVAKAKGL